MNFLTASVLITANTGQLRTQLALAKSSVSRTMTSIRSSVKAAFSKMAQYAKLAGIAIIAAMGASTKAFANFDDAMTKSIAIMKNVSVSLRAEMEKTAIKISLRSVKSATELAKAYFYLGSAGLSAEQSLKALSAVERFATAGSFDLSSATEMAVGSQAALGLSSKNAAINLKNLIRVTDNLVTANELSQATVSQFAEALTNEAAAAMKTWNIELEEGVAVLAAYAKQNIKGAEGGSAFGRMLRFMMMGARKNREEWERFGMTLYDTQGNLRPLADIIEDITNLLSDMSTEQKGITLDLLGFQARSQQVILPILGMSDSIREWNKQLVAAGGHTKDLAEKNLKSFAAQMKIVWNNIVSVAMAIGKRLAPHIETLGFLIRENRDAIEEWAVAFVEGGLHIEDSVKGVLGGFEKLALAVSYIKDGFRGLKAVFYLVSAGILKSLEYIGRGFVVLTKAAEDAHNKIAGTWLGGKLGFEKMSTGIKEMEASVQALGDEASNLLKIADDLLAAPLSQDKVKKFFNELDRQVLKRKNKITIPDTYNMLPFSGAAESIYGPKTTKSPMEDYSDTDELIENHLEGAEKVKRGWDRVGESIGYWIENASDWGQRLGDALSHGLDMTADAFTDLIMGVKVDWADLARTMLADLARIMIKMQMARILGYAFGIGGAVAHAGGTVGVTSFPMRRVPADTFAGAPRLHKGLAADEYPAILQQGEQVIPKGGGGTGNVDVRIHNEGTEKLEVSRADSYMMGDQRILDVVMKATSNHGPFRKAMGTMRR